MKYLALCLALYPFVVGAAAINLFMAFLMLRSIGITSLAPLEALGWGAVLALVLTPLAANWVRRLSQQE
jgi:hypothetical protein